MRKFLILLFLLPVLEILIFVWVGNQFGAWTVVSLIFLTALLGFLLARQQGFENLRRAQEAWGRGEYPTTYMVNSLCILIGAFLLIVPGFLTDLLGLVLLIPYSRKILQSFFLKHLKNWFSRGTFIYWRR